jgi:hypothetical protein
MLLPNSNNEADPRKESFFTMFKLNLCPQMTFPSFTAIMILIHITFFLITIFISGIKQGDQFLIPYDYPLINLFLVSPYLIKNEFEIWRIFTGIFFFNNILILIISTSVLAILGTQQLILNF